MPKASSVELVIGGMTCASCAARIEKKLNKLDGVSATVNYATEKAKVSYAGTVTPQDLVAIVEATGYTATLPAPNVSGANAAAGNADPDEKDDEVSRLRQRLVISAVLTVPVLLMAMIPPLQFDNWQWLSLTLASPVVVWGAWPFHRAAWANARHGAATMDTLISVGVGAAWLWSLWALFFGGAGMPGMRMSFDLMPSGRGWARAHLSRSRLRGHRVHPGRSLLRGQRQEALRRRPARPAGHGRQGRRRPARRRRGADPDRPARRRRHVRRPPRGEDRHRRRRGRRHLRGGRVDADR